MRNPLLFAVQLLISCGCLLLAIPVHANIPGGGINGPNVTLTDNGSTVTIANGIVSILCHKSGGQITQINYAYNNSGTMVTNQLLAGGTDGGMLYWENNVNEGLTFTYSIVSDPAGNSGNYAEIVLVSTTVTNVTMEVHYSMLRGSSGFYVAAIWNHASTNGPFSLGECRDNIYAGARFNWMSVDAARNRLMAVSPTNGAIGVQGAPVECSLWTNGIYSGQYEDKYKYSADYGNQHVYGWSSVGTDGNNIGLWNIQPSLEYHQGGPMKRDLMEHIGTTILNMLNSAHYGSGDTDGGFGAGEVWTKVFGPYFIYCNNVTSTLTGTNQAAQALYADAQAQALAEQGIDTNGQPTGATGAWPYYWFTNANYATASGRGTVTGRIAINDAYNPTASAAGLWVGVMQQPLTITNGYDFQIWTKNYQFWVKTDTNGNFTIPNVIAGNNYTLYAFGPSAAGTFQSQNQTGGNPSNTFDLPASPFSVTVTAGATNNLGAVTWAPTRIGPTVFEIGYPSRTGQNKFRHGDDYWVSEIYSNPLYPSPIWAKFLEYPFEFPNGLNYFVGQNRWTTDWNYVQPCVVSSTGFYNDSSSTITFNLPSTFGGSASFYIALCSDFQGAVEVSVNGTQIAGANGYNPFYANSGSASDTTVREGIHANFSDNRINFSAGLLHPGPNTINLDMRQTGKVNGNGYFADHAMYDYLRLELTGYIPPPPSSAAAYPGNHCNLVCWPVTPGATSYNLLRSNTSGSGFVSITNGVTGPVCGSGTNNATFLDTTALNGTPYYYAVQSANPIGSSVSSPQSPAATPSAGLSTATPAAPTGLTVTGVGHHAVDLNWSPSSGANYYTIWRSILVDNGGGASNVLNTIILDNSVTTTSYSDDTPTDGSIYSYSVTATSAGGTSTNSIAVVAVPVPGPPSAPAGLSGGITQGTNAALSWSHAPGAVGYVISRAANNASGPFILLQSVTETVYTNTGLLPGNYYYYQVTAVNAGGISPASTTVVLCPNTIVTNLNDNGLGSLRQAVTNTISGGIIAFSSNLSGGTIFLTNGSINLSNNVTIDASALTGGIAISGNNVSRAFYIAGNATNTFVNLTITGGYAYATGPLVGYGGGIYIDTGGLLNLSNCTLTGNLGFAGAALYNHGTAAINDCTFWGNNAAFGGGIQNEGNLVVNSSTFTANTANTQGGAISAPVPLALNQCTLAGNTSADGGGLHAGAGGTIFNTIIAGNGGTSGPSTNISGTVTVTGVNLTNGFPLLAPLGAYGGPTQTMPPIPGSPAIDAGAATPFSTDQRSFNRVVGSGPDLGAVESGNAIPGFTPVVTVAGDAINPVGVGGVSLREAAAFATSNSTVTFASNLSGQTITLTNGPILINPNLTIDASALTNSPIISGNAAGSIFQVNSGQSLSLYRLTFANAINTAVLSFGNLALTDCTFTGNTNAFEGGAIYNIAGTLTATNCTFSGNYAFYGGVIGISSGFTTLTYCTFAGNYCGGGGGAIDDYNSGSLTLNSCILAGNSDPSGTAPDLWMEDGPSPLTAMDCLIGNGLNSTLVNGANGNRVGATGSPVNPLLTSLGNYGGPDQTMPPLPGSPAIDTGASTSLTTDQRGYPRPAGLGPDIGAVEGVYLTSGPGKISTVTGLANGSVQFTFTNVPDANLPILATTNLTLPLASWTLVGFATETPPGSGHYTFTDPQAITNNPQRFYHIRSP